MVFVTEISLLKEQFFEILFYMRSDGQFNRLDLGRISGYRIFSGLNGYFKFSNTSLKTVEKTQQIAFLIIFLNIIQIMVNIK